MVVLGVLSGPIGLVAPLRFKTFDSQPEKSSVDPRLTHVHSVVLRPGASPKRLPSFGDWNKNGEGKSYTDSW